MLNLGFYGIMRVNLDLVPATLPAAGLIVLVVGTVSAFLGILYATTENDLKTMLAHSSIENAGIITVALGAGMVFAAAPFAGAGGNCFRDCRLSHDQPFVLQNIARAGRRSGGGSGGDPRSGPPGRPDPHHALDGLALSAGCDVHRGLASLERLCQRMAHAPDGLAQRGVVVGGREDHLCHLRGGLGADRGAGGHLLRQGVRNGLSGDVPVPRSRAGQRGPPIGADADGAVGVAVRGPGDLANLCYSGARSAPLRRWPSPVATEALVPAFFAHSPDHARLPAEFAAEFHDLGAQTGQGVMPGRGLVVLLRGGRQNPVVFAMLTSYMAVVLVVLLAMAYGLVKVVFTRRRKVLRCACWDGGVRRLLPEMTYSATGFSNPVRVIFEAIFHPTTIENKPDTVTAHFRTAIRRRRIEVHIVQTLPAPRQDGGMGAGEIAGANAPRQVECLSGLCALRAAARLAGGMGLEHWTVIE